MQEERINKLKRTIAEMESQRAVLGDATVEAALIPLRQKLAELEAQVLVPKEVEPETPTRQRKLVTLLFMDVAGSTVMTQHLDHEDTLELMDGALKRLAAPVEAHGGHVTRFMGDGFKAVFGDPIAREDDPEQAIRAGLEILAVAQTLEREIETNWEIQGFQVRIGINTGLVALGGHTEAEDTVMGLPVNLAARIESAAPPGGVLISHNTYRHVRGVFNVQPQEPIMAKGFPEPVDVYLVKEIKPRAFRVQTRGVGGVETRMVGRRTELDTLKDAIFTIFEEGEGHVVTISGEAGVGKSRLLYEFQNWLELQPPSKAVRFFLGRGEQESQGLPYSLLRDLFVFRFQILDDDRGKEARQKIENGFADVFGNDENGVMKSHIIGQLLGFDFSASPHLKGVLTDAEQLRNRGLIYLIQYFQALLQEIPVVIFLEDIHWADDSSLDIISRLGEKAAELPFLIICAARLTLFERRPYWGEGQDYHTLLELHPLTKRESRNLVTEILKLAADIPSELRELVVRGAEGNPFYTEELIKMLIEDNVIIPDEETWLIDLSRLEQVDVPSTLVGVLQARLDSLPTHERTVLQQASVVGRLFWDRIVSHIQTEGGYGSDPQLIPQTLTSLRDRELVYRHEESAFVGAVEYLFKHDVLREVTYESVLKRLRKIYHGLVADWLIGNSAERISEYNGLIAEHLLLAGREGEAGDYFFQAGESALAAYANAEAEQFYRQALERSPQDLLRANILSGLGEAYLRQGQSEQSESIWRDAIDLYRELGDRDRLADVYARLSDLLGIVDDIKAWEISQEGLELLKGAPDSPGVARLLAQAAYSAHFMNLPDRAILLSERALEMAAKVGEVEAQAKAGIVLAWQKADIDERISLIENVIMLTEANGLLRTAFLAHRAMSVIMSLYLVDLNSALQHDLISAEYARKMGFTSLLIHAFGGVYVNNIELGNLNTVDEQMVEIFREASISEARMKDFFRNYHPYLLDANGYWGAALEGFRERKNKLEPGSNTPLLTNLNFRIAETLLELNHFSELKDLTEAENVLKENREIEWYLYPNSFLLVIVYVRLGLCPEARAWLKKAVDLSRHQESNLYRTLHANAKYELANAEGHWDEAAEACKTSIEVYKNCSHRWRWARKLIDLGDVLATRNNSGDLERARETYQQSLNMFTEMGAPGYIKVLEERLREMKI